MKLEATFAGAVAGIYLSWCYDLPVGANIVLVLATIFVIARTVAPRHGLLARRIATQRVHSWSHSYGSRGWSIGVTDSASISGMGTSASGSSAAGTQVPTTVTQESSGGATPCTLT